jgi:hypothetical protein
MYLRLQEQQLARSMPLMVVPKLPWQTCAPCQLAGQLAVLRLQLLYLALRIQQLLCCAASGTLVGANQRSLGCLLRACKLSSKPAGCK